MAKLSTQHTIANGNGNAGTTYLSSFSSSSVNVDIVPMEQKRVNSGTDHKIKLTMRNPVFGVSGRV